jgi:N-acetylmuramoyl-L-alanine amidase
MKIIKGRLAGVPFVAANASGGDMVPSLIVVHDTAGRLDKGSSVCWFRSKECPTSAHVVVERDGTITQMVPFNKRAWHAGKSSWRGKTFCNAFSIGIEIVNPGALDKNGRAWFHKPTDKGYPVTEIEHKSTAEHGDAWWLPYPDVQIQAVKKLCRALCEEYPDCNEIVTHWMISPRRKIDTNPLFPLEEVRAYAFGIDDDDEEVPVKPPADAISTAPPPPTAAHSTEVQTATISGGAGAFGIYQTAQPSLAKATAGGTLDLNTLIWSLLTDPIFMALLAGVFCAAYAGFKRVSRLKTEGV